MTTPLCFCLRPMVQRTNKATGQKFYGCAKFSKGGCGETAEHEDEKPQEIIDLENAADADREAEAKAQEDFNSFLQQ